MDDRVKDTHSYPTQQQISYIQIYKKTSWSSVERINVMPNLSWANIEHDRESKKRTTVVLQIFSFLFEGLQGQRTSQYDLKEIQ